MTMDRDPLDANLAALRAITSQALDARSREATNAVTYQPLDGAETAPSAAPIRLSWLARLFGA
jgi:hypothetical protein